MWCRAAAPSLLYAHTTNTLSPHSAANAIDAYPQYNKVHFLDLLLLVFPLSTVCLYSLTDCVRNDFQNILKEFIKSYRA